MFLLLVLDPTWLAIILKDGYAQDQFIQQILHSIQAGVPPKGFTFHNGLFFYMGRFYLGLHCPLKSEILHFIHGSPLAAHSCFLKYYHRAKIDFYWQGTKADLKRFDRECDVCRIKSETFVPVGILNLCPFQLLLRLM